MVLYVDDLLADFVKETKSKSTDLPFNNASDSDNSSSEQEVEKVEKPTKKSKKRKAQTNSDTSDSEEVEEKPTKKSKKRKTQKSNVKEVNEVASVQKGSKKRKKCSTSESTAKEDIVEVKENTKEEPMEEDLDLDHSSSSEEFDFDNDDDDDDDGEERYESGSDLSFLDEDFQSHTAVVTETEEPKKSAKEKMQEKLLGMIEHIEYNKAKPLTKTQRKKQKKKLKKQQEKLNNSKVEDLKPHQLLQLQRPCQVVEYTGHVRKLKKPKHNQSDEETEEAPVKQLDMRQLKFEVQKVGIKGMDKRSAAEERKAQLIMLGAIVPKKQYKNYKELVEDRKREHEDKVRLRDQMREMGTKMKISKSKKKDKRDINHVGALDGQVGRYKQGVQVLSKKSIQKPASKQW